MQGIKILYITTEISPFLETSSMSSSVRNAVGGVNKQKAEIRVFLPCFGVIKQLKNRIHSIYRLSGINIPIGKEDFSLVVKVASLKELKTQVYFTDNEDLFQRKGVFKSPEDQWYEDNDTRFVFFNKGILVTIKELNWSPDIIHCHGLFSALIPMYLKTAYKNTPVFKHTKCVHTFYPEELDISLKEDIFKKARLRDVKEEDLDSIGQGYSKDLMNIAASFSDYSTRTFEPNSLYDADFLDKLNIKHYPENESLVESYIDIYKKLLY